MSGDGRRSRRALRPDERRLWTTVTRSISPLRSRAPDALAVEEADPAAAAIPEAPVGKKPRTIPTTPKPVRAPPPLAPLDRRSKQRIARGCDPIDARIDLHGFTQLDAHAALHRFLHVARADGARLVLVITGKGSPEGGKGVLRRQVPLWLRLPEFRDLVVGFEAAHRGHGGEGALYVRLRRARRTSGKP